MALPKHEPSSPVLHFSPFSFISSINNMIMVANIYAVLNI